MDPATIGAIGSAAGGILSSVFGSSSDQNAQKRMNYEMQRRDHAHANAMYQQQREDMWKLQASADTKHWSDFYASQDEFNRSMSEAQRQYDLARQDARYQSDRDYRWQVDSFKAQMDEAVRQFDQTRADNWAVWEDQKAFESSKIQRTVADAIAAGVHPIYALGLGGTFSGGTSFSSGNVPGAASGAAVVQGSSGIPQPGGRSGSSGNPGLAAGSPGGGAAAALPATRGFADFIGPALSYLQEEKRLQHEGMELENARKKVELLGEINAARGVMKNPDEPQRQYIASENARMNQSVLTKRTNLVSNENGQNAWRQVFSTKYTPPEQGEVDEAQYGDAAVVPGAMNLIRDGGKYQLEVYKELALSISTSLLNGVRNILWSGKVPQQIRR